VVANDLVKFIMAALNISVIFKLALFSVKNRENNKIYESYVNMNKFIAKKSCYNN
jgi:hypothetical protein